MRGVWPPAPMPATGATRGNLRGFWGRGGRFGRGGGIARRGPAVGLTSGGVGPGDRRESRDNWPIMARYTAIERAPVAVDSRPIRRSAPVRLEFPILSLTPGLGTVAWRLTSALRGLADEGPPAHPASLGRHDREAVWPRWRASGDRGAFSAQAAADRSSHLHRPCFADSPTSAALLHHTGVRSSLAVRSSIG